MSAVDAPKHGGVCPYCKGKLDLRASPSSVVEVFVRLDKNQQEEARVLSFKIPKAKLQNNQPTTMRGFAHHDLLDAGFAIDGNTAICSVAAWTDPIDGKHHSLVDELFKKQRELVDWFKERAFEVSFE